MINGDPIDELPSHHRHFNNKISLISFSKFQKVSTMSAFGTFLPF